MIETIAFFEFLIILWLLYERDGLIRRIGKLEKRSKKPDVIGRSKYNPRVRIADDEVLQ